MIGMMITPKSETLADVLAEKPWLYKYLNEECQKDKALAQIVFEKNGKMLEYAPESVCSDAGLATLAIEHGAHFWMVSEELQNNKDFILEALEWCDDVPDHVGKKFLADLDILYKAVDIYAENYEYFSKKLRDNRDIALACVKINGQVYNSLCQKLKCDQEIITEAVSHGLSLGDLHPKAPGLHKILDNRAIITEAIRHNSGNELGFASNTLREDKAFAEYAIDNGLTNLKCLGTELRNDKEIIKKVIANMTAAKVSEYDFIKNIVAIPQPLRADDDFLLELIAISESLFPHIATKEYQQISMRSIPINQDITFCQKAYDRNPKTLKYMGNAMKKSIKKK